MRILTAEDLPPVPAGKTGWPWEAAAPAQAFEGEGWPKFSVVMPSFRYGRFIEEAIRSVLLQGYPHFELIVMDGGSKDETVDILKKYEPFLASWVSEKDEGQTDAINRGFEKCTGDAFQWLNADDMFQPGAFAALAPLLKKGTQLAGGICRIAFVDGSFHLSHSEQSSFWKYLHYWKGGFATSPIFVSMDVARKAFPLSKNLYSVMDVQFFLRILAQDPAFAFVNHEITYFRYHGGNKTGGTYTEGSNEFRTIALEESARLSSLPRWWFEVELNNYLTLQKMMRESEQPGLGRMLTQILSRPALLLEPVCWSLLGKAFLGPKRYAKVKKMAGRS